MVLVVTTLFFATMSSRMVPGSAIVAAAAAADVRGAFMALKVTVHAVAMAVGSTFAAALLGRDAAGRMTGFAECGWLAVGLSLLAVWWARRIEFAMPPRGIPR